VTFIVQLQTGHVELTLVVERCSYVW